MKKNNHALGGRIFRLSVIIALAISAWGIIGSRSFSETADFLMVALKENFSWLYVGAMLFFVLFAIAAALGPSGKIRLGGDGERPEHGLMSWFAMLFAAGMGIGLVFWGVAEPLSHYISPDSGIEPASAESAAFAIRSSFMHWGLHPWACYAVMGLGLAFFQFRRKEPSMVSNMFQPLFGKKAASGALGEGIDIFTAVLTAIGVATSFGMGCLQICAGLEYLFGIPDRTVTRLALILAICAIYTMSSVRGLERGISPLSDFNLILFVSLAALAFVVGPGSDIARTFFAGMGDYLAHFFPDSLKISTNGDSAWILGWRVFYWAWWLSWAPFTGMFIARISKGRTVREFILGAMLVPALVSCVWFAISGGLSLHVAGNFTADQLREMIASPQTALFHIFGQYPLGAVMSALAVVLLICFFVTSANSAVFVLAMLTSDGDRNPPDNKKIFWGILIALIAVALILSGGVAMIQTVTIVIAFPYLFILLLLCLALAKEFIREKHMRPH